MCIPSARSRRLLDWTELSQHQWLNFGGTSGQTHRWTDWAVGDEHRRKNELQAIQQWWLGRVWACPASRSPTSCRQRQNTAMFVRTNGIVRQHTGRWHRRQNMRDWRRKDSPANSRKFGKVWEQTKVTTRLVVSYFNWIWQHSRLKSTAAQRAGLATRSWTWHDIAIYPTLSWRTISYLTKAHLEGRLNYAEIAVLKLPIGSGAIESLIRQVVNLRMKGNGKFWLPNNAEIMLHARCQWIAGNWNNLCDSILTALINPASE